MSDEKSNQLKQEEFALEDPEKAVSGIAAKHSARYVKERNVKLYLAIRLALMYNIPHEEIAREAGVSANLVRAIEREEFVALEEGKKKLIGDMRLFRHRAIHRMLNEVDNFKLEALPIAFGIVSEKEILESGGATQRVEHVTNPKLEGARERLAAARRRLAPGMVLEGELAPANGEPLALPVPSRISLTDSVHANTLNERTDSQSVTEPTQSVDNQ